MNPTFSVVAIAMGVVAFAISAGVLVRARSVAKFVRRRYEESARESGDSIPPNQIPGIRVVLVIGTLAVLTSCLFIVVGVMGNDMNLSGLSHNAAVTAESRPKPSPWLLLAMAVFALGAGVVMIVFRVWVTETIARAHRASFGQLGKRSADRATPIQVVLPAIGFVGFGIFLLVQSIQGFVGN